MRTKLLRQRSPVARQVARRLGMPAQQYELQALEQRLFLSAHPLFMGEAAWALLEAGTQWYAASLVEGKRNPKTVETSGNGNNGGSTSSSGGQIGGSLWEDRNGNSTRDAGEGPLVGWTVYLDRNSNGSFDGGDLSTTTDSQGNYSFSGLEVGEYVVAQVVPSGWRQTAPQVDPPTDVIFSAANAGEDSDDQSTQATAAIAGELVASDASLVLPALAQSGPLINLTAMRQDPRFDDLTGSGLAVVVIDTGIDLDHSAFGPDADNNGIADRIVYQYDFTGSDDANAQDFSGHGSNVTSIIASQNSTYPGVAPGVNIIHLKVFPDNGGGGSFADIEQALRWTVNNMAAYNIAAVNLSLSDGANYTSDQQRYGISDELASLAANNVIVVAAAGNSFYSNGSTPGVAYPAADPNVLAVGAVYDASAGGFTYSSGAQAYSSGADRLAPFSQRHLTMMDILAPGAPITGANATGGWSSYHGTSQASPHVAGAAVLAQQLAQRELGRWLSFSEFAQVLRDSAVQVYDGDDEADNVENTNLYYPRIDMLAMAQAIVSLTPPNVTPSGGRIVQVGSNQQVDGVDFASQALPASVSGRVFDDFDVDGTLDSGEPGLQGWTVFADANGNGQLDAGERWALSNAQGDYSISNLQYGQVQIRQVLPAGWGQIAPAAAHLLTLNPGETRGNVNFANSATSISGIAWQDEDSDGLIDAGEQPLVGRTIYADLDGDAQWDQGEPHAITDSQGAYRLANLIQGQYRLRQVLPSDWLGSDPLAGTLVDVAAGDSVSDVNFGSRRIAYLQNANGLVVLEAELHDGSVSVGDKSWSPVTRSGASGSAMQALPNTQTAINSGYEQTSPRLDYRIQFNQAGTYYVWVRGLGLADTDDSLHLGLNGQALSSADRAALKVGSSFAWSRATMDGPVITIDVPTAGIHTLNLWMREDGAVVDRILLTPSSSYNPGSGVGPATSARESVPVSQPSLQVLGNNLAIGNGDNSPSAADHTDFGSITQGEAPVQRTFTVRNTGSATLSTSNLSLPAGFSLIEPLAEAIAPGESDSFTIQLDSDQAGNKSGLISFASNDAGQSQFSFAIAGKVTQPGTFVTAYQQAANGLVVLEAELNDGLTSVGGKSWSPIARSGASGSAMQALPNTQTAINSGYVDTSPRMDYLINFTQVGIHYVWLRGTGLADTDDSVHVGLDGQAIASADRAALRVGSNFTWSNATMDGPVITINVTTPGLHTLNIWMREDGAMLDRILLSTSSNYNPGTTSIGPATSARELTQVT